MNRYFQVTFTNNIFSNVTYGIQYAVIQKQGVRTESAYGWLQIIVVAFGIIEILLLYHFMNCFDEFYYEYALNTRKESFVIAET